ncbi:hypothetical protein MJ904_23910 [Massilia sp. MB5]|uniref:hypothetical protein n=1 Tax=unclassified Massilia TaxID=2609279 RepID=UPI00067B1BC5|nr:MULTISPECIES: hypothetical protein [unclassified Massilia]AKU20514.1 hypothetical protein ACZ75_02255 [Massilia sp. NR 4-1]UMR30029.1 hypothetical protein MJ904_23910 [Massilia sp. MB5]
MINLTGSWTHSFEEDEGSVQVFRPTQAFDFPPARRGRETVDFGMGGGPVVRGMPGADDRQQHSHVNLTALGMNRFRLEGPGMPGQVFELVEARPDVLKLRQG